MRQETNSTALKVEENPPLLSFNGHTLNWKSRMIWLHSGLALVFAMTAGLPQRAYCNDSTRGQRMLQTTSRMEAHINKLRELLSFLHPVQAESQAIWV